ncbi:MAG: SPOR domain-containing protein [Myxococcota bacterium]
MIRDPRRAPERIPSELVLDRVQVIWLTLGGLVVVGLSFALGLVAGRRAERLEAQAAQSADPLEAIEEESQQLAFYRELKDEPPLAPAPAVVAEAERRIARAEADAQKPRKNAAQAAKTPDETQAEAAEPATRKPAPKRAPKPAAPKPATPQPATPQPAAPKAARQKQTRATDGGDVKTKLRDGPALGGQYTVQVSAFQSMDEAQAFAASLERKGYAPFITTASLPKKGTWFRVRMGAFDNELEATLAKQILAQRDIPAWVLKAE